jgi:hypothetical protein
LGCFFRRFKKLPEHLDCTGHAHQRLPQACLLHVNLVPAALADLDFRFQFSQAGLELIAHVVSPVSD